MKFLKLLSLLILSIFLSCCTKADDNEIEFDAKSLAQTTWEGTNVVTDGDQIVRTINVEMQFITSTNGRYVLKEKDSEVEVYDFKYSIEGKIMNIEDGPLFGNRTLIEIGKDKIVLEALSSYRSTLTLVRMY